MNDTVLAIVHPDYIRPGEGRGRDKEGGIRSSIMRGYCSMQKAEAIAGMPYPRDMAGWWRRRDSSEIRFDENGKPYIKGSAVKDGVIARIKLVNDEAILEIEN